MTAIWAAYRAGYQNLWNRARLSGESRKHTIDIVRKLIEPSALEHYRTAAAATEVPVALLIALNYRESGGRFDTYLGNGDPLNRITVHVPKNRGPWPSWEAGAIDALKEIERPADGIWSVPFCLFVAEAFNGRGYEQHNENSPYIWSQTTLEQRGMYVADGEYSQLAWDARPGVAAIFMALQEIAPGLSLPTSRPPAETPMTVPTTTPASNPFPAILQGLQFAMGLLPMLAQFVPKAEAPILSVGIPLVQDFVSFIEQAHEKGVGKVDTATMLEKVAAHLQAIATSLKQT